MLVTDLIELPEESWLEFFEDGVIEHIDFVVLVGLCELVGRCFRVYSRHDCRGDDGEVESIETVFVLLEDEE